MADEMLKNAQPQELESQIGEEDSLKEQLLRMCRQNKLAASGSGMITYICYISYYDSETKNTVNISADITYTLVKNAENARLAYVTSDTYVFKYNTEGTIVGAVFPGGSWLCGKQLGRCGRPIGSARGCHRSL